VLNISILHTCAIIS